MAGREQYTVEQVAAALTKATGRAMSAALILGCSRRAVNGYIGRHPELREVQYDARERVIDAVEGVLVKKALGGDIAAMCFFMKCQAKHRGYVERTETQHSGPGGGPIPLAAFPMAEQNAAAAAGTLLEEAERRGISIGDVSLEARQAALLRLCDDIGDRPDDTPLAEQERKAADDAA